MTVENLCICYPKQSRDHYRVYSRGNDTPKYRFGDIPKKLIPSDAIIEYDSCDGLRKKYGEVRYFGDAKTTKLEEHRYWDGNKCITKSQELKNDKNMSVKNNTVSSYGKEYSSTHILDRGTGLEAVVRRKGNEVIGGYNVAPVKRTFAQGFKGRLQKLGMAVATDANGCERPVLKNIGEMILKVAKRIK